MRIAVIGSRGYPSTYGGFETFVRVLAPALVQKGHSITVYGRSRQRRHRRRLHAGISVIDVFGSDSKRLSTLSAGLAASLDAAIRGYDAALVVNVANGFFLPLLQARGIGTVLNVDGVEWERGKWGRLARATFLRGAQLSAHWADRLIADSHAISEIWRERFGVRPTFIPYGAHVVPQRRSGRIESMGLTPESYVLVVARFAPENNIELTLDALDLLDERPAVVVVGSGNYRLPLDDRLEHLEKEGRVRRLGHVKDQELLNELWANAGVYVHGHSVGGTNPALLQALGSGAPTLAFPSVFNREVVGSERLLYEPDPSSLALRIREILASAALRDAMRQAGQTRVAQDYRWNDVCDAYERELLAVARCHQ